MTALVLQARLDSTRLPGKSLLSLGGRPLIFRVMEALNRVPCNARILACPEDCAEAFAPLAAEAGFALVSGSKEDVLARYCAALRSLRPRPAYLIRATGDNPFVFADAAAGAAREGLARAADYTGYAELPHGAGVEFVKAAALFRAEREARAPAEREHVCPYLYNNPGLFRLHRPPAPAAWRADLRLTVDTPADFALAERLYAALEEYPAAVRHNGQTILDAYRKIMRGEASPLASTGVLDCGSPKRSFSARPPLRVSTPQRPAGNSVPGFDREVKSKDAAAILIVPACETGVGGGHLIRSAALLRTLLKSGGDAWLCLPGKDGACAAALSGLEEKLITKEACALKSWSLVVLDRFKTSPAELSLWSSLGPVVGIDEGGCRENFDFLIDLLPGPPGRSPPNLLKPAFLPLPEKRRLSFYERRRRPFRILVSFGAEDPAGLTVPVALALTSTRVSQTTAGASTAAAAALLDEIHITVHFGPLCRASTSGTALLEQAGIQVCSGEGKVPLRESFSGYNLIITHFGLSAFEALSAKVPVLLVSPGAYHETLARNAGFASAGKGKRGAARIVSLLFTKNRLDEDKLRYIAGKSEAAAVRWGLDREPEDLGAFLLSWKPEIYRECPVCAAPRSQSRTANHRLLARFPDRTYRRCRVCGTVFMDRTVPPAQEYNAAYFFDEYQSQYGKTYLEDFPALKENGKRRLTVIKALLKNRSAGKRLLDLGCAYGPFLAAAREEGFIPTGMDPSEEAVRHVRDVLAIPAVQGFFPRDIGLVQESGRLPHSEPVFKQNAYNVITLWYVIEHLNDLREALELANRLLADGGVLAFSTPSFGGVSRRKSLSGFLEKSPGDHRTIWDPRNCAAILARFSFKVKKIVITGHHPERFPFAGRFLRKGGVMYRFFLGISRLFGLGDTFEVYAVKTSDIQTGMSANAARGMLKPEEEP